VTSGEAAEERRPRRNAAVMRRQDVSQVGSRRQAGVGDVSSRPDDKGTGRNDFLAVFPRSKRFLYAKLSKCVFHVDGKPVEFVKSYPHLGHIINARMDDTGDISRRWGVFIVQVNNVLCYLNTLNSHTKYRLFQSYCTSFYGCELWCLLDDEVQGLCIAWRKSIRKI